MDINSVVNSLDTISELFCDHILSSYYCRKINTVTWSKYSHGIENKLIYAKRYEDLLNNQQYSFLLNDKSFFQFYFAFDDAGLAKAKLAYYPFPVASMESSEDLEEYFSLSGNDLLDTYYFGLRELHDLGIIASNNSHLRLDYDRDVTSHSKSHMQYSGINDLRIPFVKLIDPLLFFEFIIRNLSHSSHISDILDSSKFSTQKNIAAGCILDMGNTSGLYIDFNPS